MRHWFAVEQESRRMLCPVKLDAGVTGGEQKLAWLIEIRLPSNRRQRNSAVHRACVEKRKAQPLSDAAGDCRFAGPGRTVDRQDHGVENSREGRGWEIVGVARIEK